MGSAFLVMVELGRLYGQLCRLGLYMHDDNLGDTSPQTWRRRLCCKLKSVAFAAIAFLTGPALGIPSAWPTQIVLMPKNNQTAKTEACSCTVAGPESLAASGGRPSSACSAVRFWPAAFASLSFLTSGSASAFALSAC